MTNDEAKFILQAYRPDGRDASDPQMAPALAQARTDPRLGEWFGREQAHAAAVAAKLGEVAPPAGLRDAILAGGRASRPGVSSRAGWRLPAWLGLAAAIMAIVGAGWWWGVPADGATFEEFAINTVGRGFRLQKHSADVGELKHWLAQQQGPLPEALPAEFAQLRALGCRTLRYRTSDVSLVCFEQGGREFHVFVARRAELPHEVAPLTPHFRREGKLAAAAWSDAARHYVVVTDADLRVLQRLLL